MKVRNMAVALAAVAASFGGGIAIAAPGSTSGGEPAPSAYASWKAEAAAEIHCSAYAPVKGTKWEACLVGAWDKGTHSQLVPAEYTLDKPKGTWKVTWSHVVLPKGGKALTKAQKATRGIPSTVYCKTYTVRGSSAVLCNNGDRI